MKHEQVREIVSVLDLDVLYYPCPRNGPNFRTKVAQMGGKQQFPYMVRFCSFPFFFSMFLLIDEKMRYLDEKKIKIQIFKYLDIECISSVEIAENAKECYINSHYLSYYSIA